MSDEDMLDRLMDACVKLEREGVPKSLIRHTEEALTDQIRKQHGSDRIQFYNLFESERTAKWFEKTVVALVAILTSQSGDRTKAVIRRETLDNLQCVHVDLIKNGNP